MKQVATVVKVLFHALAIGYAVSYLGSEFPRLFGHSFMADLRNQVNADTRWSRSGHPYRLSQTPIPSSLKLSIVIHGQHNNQHTINGYDSKVFGGLVMDIEECQGHLYVLTPSGCWKSSNKIPFGIGFHNSIEAKQLESVASSLVGARDVVVHEDGTMDILESRGLVHVNPKKIPSTPKVTFSQAMAIAPAPKGGCFVLWEGGRVTRVESDGQERTVREEVDSSSLWTGFIPSKEGVKLVDVIQGRILTLDHEGKTISLQSSSDSPEQALAQTGMRWMLWISSAARGLAWPLEVVRALWVPSAPSPEGRWRWMIAWGAVAVLWMTWDASRRVLNTRQQAFWLVGALACPLIVVPWYLLERPEGEMWPCFQCGRTHRFVGMPCPIAP